MDKVYGLEAEAAGQLKGVCWQALILFLKLMNFFSSMLNPSFQLQAWPSHLGPPPTCSDFFFIINKLY